MSLVMSGAAQKKVRRTDVPEQTFCL